MKGKEETKANNFFTRILSLLLINVILMSLFTPYSVVFASDTDGKVEFELVTTSTDTSIIKDNLYVYQLKMTYTPSGINVIGLDFDYDTSIFEIYYDENDGEYVYSGKNSWSFDADDPDNPTGGTLTKTTLDSSLNRTFFTITLKAKQNAEMATVSMNIIEIAGGGTISYDGNVKPCTIGAATVSHTVTYDYATNGGTASTATTATVAENAAIDLTQTATKTGYNFVGWNTNSSATTGLSSLNMGTNDVTLYAIFSKTITATCHYYDNNATAQTQAVTGTMYNNDASANITLPTLTENYVDANSKTWTRNGWTNNTAATTTAGTAEGSNVTINANSDYYMLYKRNINVSYNVNGGNSIAPTTQIGAISVNSSNIAQISGANITITSTIPTNPGYTFQNSWNTASNGTGTPYASNAQYTFTDDETLYAQWNGSLYTIIYNGNTNTSGTMNNTSYNYGNGSVTLNPNGYSKTGYTFKGWALTNNASSPAYTNSISDADILANAVNGNVTLYAVWGAESHNVSFNTNGGNTISDITVEYDSTYGANGTLPTPIKAGYNFEGWYTSLNGGTKIENTTTVTTTTAETLYAHWSAATYTVTLNENYAGGSTSTIQVTYNSTYGANGTLPTPSRTGITFTGWYTDPTAGTQVTDTTPVTITSDTTLYAHWDVAQYTVTLNANGGDPLVQNTITVVYGGTYNTLPTTATKAGYTFAGWYTDPTAGTQVTTSTPVTITDNTQILYAHWIPAATTYTLNIYEMDTTGNYPTTPNTTTENDISGNIIIIANLAANKLKAGFAFDSTTTGATTATVLGDGTTVINIYYTRNQYQYTLGTATGADTTGSTVTGTYYYQENITLNATAQTGYAWKEWKSNDLTIQSNISDAITTITMPAGDITLTPYVEAIQNKVIYDYTTNGGTSSSLTNNNVNVNYGDTIDLTTPTATKAGYTFVGWNTNSTATTAQTTPLTMGTSDITVYAIYKKDIAITGYYLDSTGTQQTITSNTVTLYNNDTTVNATLPTLTEEYTDSNGDTWTRNGWSSNTVATTVAGDSEGNTVSISDNTNYYMLYTKQITVTYNENGGNPLTTSSATGNLSVNAFDKAQVKDAEITITNEIPTKIGYIFDNKWNKAQDGSLNNYATGSTANFNEDTQLYAQYIPDTTTSYTVEHYKEQANGSYAIDSTLTENLTGTTGDTATATPKTIVGYTENTTHTDRVASGVIAGNGSLVLKLYYKLNEYTVTFKDDDGTVLDTQTIKHGEAATAPANPTKAADAQYTYTFNAWDKAFNNITSDLDIIATYTQTLNQYTVIFYDEDGTTELGRDTVDYGTAATAPADPTKAGDAQYSYVFAGWDTAFNNITGNLDVKATYNQVVNQYTVTFYDEDGTTVLATAQADYGTSAVYPNPVPTKTGLPGHIYTFDKWVTTVGGTTEDDLTNVIADRDVYATYTDQIATYIVTFDVNGGDSLSNNTKNVTYGDPYGDLPTPTRTGYTFLGWFDKKDNGNKIESTTTVTATKNHVLYANWEIIKYTVEFIGKINDGSPEGIDGVLTSVQVPYGNSIIPSQLGINIDALKATVVTPKYTYTVNSTTPFIGDLTSTVTADRQINVNYNTPTINQYTITFYDEDGVTVLGTDTVDYGDTADDTYINPIKASDNTYDYTFEKWLTTAGGTTQDNLDNVIADRNVYAKYLPIYKNYEVKFVDEDGITEISSKADYHYGDNLVIPGDPTKAATAEFTYTFAGWVNSQGDVVDVNNETVTQNTTYTAKYNQTINQYTITFYDEDGTTVLGTATVDYGTNATAPILPTKADNNGYTFTFEKWVTTVGGTTEDDLTNVVADRDVYATYTQQPIVYTITYIDTNGASNPNPTTYTVEDADITLLPLGQKVGMSFGGWYTDTTYSTPINSIITANLGNITVYAKWDIESLMYFVKTDATVDNTDSSVMIYDNFDDAKAYVDTLFDNGNGTALGIYDLNNDLVYYPEEEVKLYYVKDNETVDNSLALKYNDFDDAKAYVDTLFDNGRGTITRIYDQNNKLVYEPKVENPAIQYFVKVNSTDANDATNTYTNFNDAKAAADAGILTTSGIKVYDINGDIVYEPQIPEDDLYLKSQVYKIGTTNQDQTLDEYVDGDLYLYRVSPNTKLSDFISNCETNGTIKVYKQSGEELTADELVGTGMTLKDEKNGKVITVTIGVTGDLDGSGDVDITDLVKVRQNIQETITLSGVYKLAGDINEDETVDITDLVKIRKHIQEIEYIR